MMNTAAGQISVISSARSSVRGGTFLRLGTLSDGRYTVTSRFQWEVITKDRLKAESIFKQLTEAQG